MCQNHWQWTKLQLIAVIFNVIFGRNCDFIYFNAENEKVHKRKNKYFNAQITLSRITDTMDVIGWNF